MPTPTTEQMTALGFRYRIGDIVAHVGDLHQREPIAAEDLADRWLRREILRDMPKRFVVLGRIADECPGCVQLHYNCRAYGRSSDGAGAGFTRDLVCFHQEELADYPTVLPPPAPTK